MSPGSVTRLWPLTLLALLPLAPLPSFRLGHQFSIEPARPVMLSSRASKSLSNQCSVEGSVTPRSQTLSEPISRKVASADSRAASFKSS